MGPGLREGYDRGPQRASCGPSSGETASCGVVFVLVYYFNMAGVTWFAVLSYSWHLAFGALGSTRDLMDGKKGHFHLVAWTFPLVLTIVCLALTQVSGHVSRRSVVTSRAGQWSRLSQVSGHISALTQVSGHVSRRSMVTSRLSHRSVVTSLAGQWSRLSQVSGHISALTQVSGHVSTLTQVSGRVI